MHFQAERARQLVSFSLTVTFEYTKEDMRKRQMRVALAKTLSEASIIANQVLVQCDIRIDNERARYGTQVLHCSSVVRATFSTSLTMKWFTISCSFGVKGANRLMWGKIA